MISSRHLFGPGPSNPWPEATEALAQPLLGHLDPAFLTVMDEACEMLRTAWGTTNARTLPIPPPTFVAPNRVGLLVVVGWYAYALLRQVG